MCCEQNELIFLSSPFSWFFFSSFTHTHAYTKKKQFPHIINGEIRIHVSIRQMCQHHVVQMNRHTRIHRKLKAAQHQPAIHTRAHLAQHPRTRANVAVVMKLDQVDTLTVLTVQWPLDLVQVDIAIAPHQLDACRVEPHTDTPTSVSKSPPSSNDQKKYYNVCFLTMALNFLFLFFFPNLCI